MPFIAKGNKALAVITKAGAQSMREVMSDGWYRTNEQALEYPIRIMFVRNPRARLKSAYSFFNGLKQQGTRYDKIDFSTVDRWETFVDMALDPSTDDEHWNTQKSSVLFNDQLVPNKIFRFEEINEIFPHFIPRAMPHLNQSERLPTNDYRRTDIDQFYNDDSNLWNSAIRKTDLGEQWPGH